MQKIPVKIKKLQHYRGDLPLYQTDFASGFDVRAQLGEAVLDEFTQTSMDARTIVLKPGARVLVTTALSFEIPEGYEIQARPRSGWAIKQGISLVNTPGTIDADYRGEVKIILINLGQEPVEIKDQDRIAQLVLCPIVHAAFEVVEELGESGRGAGGFGSTGTKN